MEKFSFEKWKNGAKVITGYGREVKDLTYLPNAHPTECFVGVVNCEIKTWSYEGIFNVQKRYQLGDSWDLCHPDEEMYVNVYTHSSGLYIAGDIVNDPEKLKKYIITDSYVGTYKLVKI